MPLITSAIKSLFNEFMLEESRSQKLDQERSATLELLKNPASYFNTNMLTEADSVEFHVPPELSVKICGHAYLLKVDVIYFENQERTKNASLYHFETAEATSDLMKIQLVDKIAETLGVPKTHISIGIVLC